MLKDGPQSLRATRTWTFQFFLGCAHLPFIYAEAANGDVKLAGSNFTDMTAAAGEKNVSMIKPSEEGVVMLAADDMTDDF